MKDYVAGCYIGGGQICTTSKPKGTPDLKGTGGIISVFKNAETGQWDEVPEASSGTNPGSTHHNRYVKLSWTGISDWGKNCGRGSHHYEVQIRESGKEAGQEIPFILAKYDAIVGERLIAEDNPDNASEVWYYFNYECMGLNTSTGVDCEGYCYYNTDKGTIEPNQTADGRFCESDACSDSELVSCSCGSGSEDYIPCETGNGTTCVTYEGTDTDSGCTCQPMNIPDNYCSDRCVYSGGQILPKDDDGVSGNDSTDACPQSFLGSERIYSPMVIFWMSSEEVTGESSFPKGSGFRVDLKITKPAGSVLDKLVVDVVEAAQDENGDINWFLDENGMYKTVAYTGIDFTGDTTVTLKGTVEDDGVNRLAIRVYIPLAIAYSPGALVTPLPNPPAGGTRPRCIAP